MNAAESVSPKRYTLKTQFSLSLLIAFACIRNSASGTNPRVVRRGKKNTIPESLSQNPALLEAIRHVSATLAAPSALPMCHHVSSATGKL